MKFSAKILILWTVILLISSLIPWGSQTTSVTANIPIGSDPNQETISKSFTIDQYSRIDVLVNNKTGQNQITFYQFCIESVNRDYNDEYSLTDDQCQEPPSNESSVRKIDTILSPGSYKLRIYDLDGPDGVISFTIKMNSLNYIGIVQLLSTPLIIIAVTYYEWKIIDKHQGD